MSYQVIDAQNLNRGAIFRFGGVYLTASPLRAPSMLPYCYVETRARTTRSVGGCD